MSLKPVPVETRPNVSEVGVPIWWNHHGFKMNITDRYSLRLSSNVAELVVLRHGSGQWSLHWMIKHGYYQSCHGQTVLTTAQLQAAFGITDVTEEGSYWLIERFPGSAAHQGGFFRLHEYLNIPAPGTGHDGDANISVLITPEMRDIIQAMIARG